MNSNSSHSVSPIDANGESILWYFVNPIQLHELYNAHYVGDNQSRLPLRIRLERRGTVNVALPAMNLRIERSQREDGSGNCYNFEGYLETSRGLIAVEGFLRVMSVKNMGGGNLRARQFKSCPACSRTPHIRNHESRRCQECGTELVVIKTPNLAV